jgi:hypothetical protein
LNELFFFGYSVMRAVLGATIVAVILPMIDAYGAAMTYLLCAILIWTSYGYVIISGEKKGKQMDSLIMTFDSGLYYIIKYGDQMRAGIDIGFLAVENNNSKLPDCT